MSHYLLISVVELAPPASSANEDSFAVEATCKLMIRGWMLRSQRAIARTASDNCFYVLVTNVVVMFTSVFIDLVVGPLSITTRI